LIVAACSLPSNTTTPDKLAHYAPIFEAAAQATRGAVEPQSSSMAAGALSGAVIGGIAGAVGAFLAVRAKRKRQAAAPAKPSASGLG